MPPFPTLMLLVFALTLFASATLLFLVEPMVGKMILPLLGGTPAVWNTCMVFFQAVLLAGYAYAHATTAWLGARKQALLHLAVLLIPFLFFPLGVNRVLLEGGEENPIPRLLLMLTVCVGMPMLVISTSAPLLQKWFASTSHPAARDPYFLYGASNLGSMIALLGYPVLVEPFFSLHAQTLGWSIGFGVLVALTALCALFLWKSPPPALVSEAASAVPVQEVVHAAHRDSGSRSRGRHRGRKQTDKVRTAPPSAVTTAPAADAEKEDPDAPHPLGSAVTSGRRLRWVLLAAVPSSLMLGATTYITTDIAAIPLLWVLPLGLYLLSFIIVFAHIPPRVQGVLLAAVATAAGIGVGILLWHIAEEADRPMLKGFSVLCLAGAAASWLILRVRSNDLLHSAMVIALPLVVLTLAFFMLRESLMWEKRLPVSVSIGLHLGALFVVSMVCHGELARDRPDTGHLTEYFLWMSVGGVLGGLFNALVAPLVFNGIAEYPLAMVAACLLLPSLSRSQESSWGRRADVALALLFLSIGTLLIVLRVLDHDLDYPQLAQGPWGWELGALVFGLALGVGSVLRGRRNPVGHALDRWLDLALPASLGVLVIGLLWGLPSDAVRPRIIAVADLLHVAPTTFRLILTLGLPAVLCYTFIERSLRFGLGLGALFLAATFSSGVHDSLLFQKRSFFGVLRVEYGVETVNGEELHSRRLIHGTTMHGKQFLNESRRDEPLTYYHRSGPIGQVFTAYNDDPKKNYAVIGLGTGTMACYALPGQHVTFYDIDPVVRDISFKEDNPYFTFVEDARKRGAHVDLVLGDARVMLEKQHLAPEEKYSLMVIDAFSSDAIPMHLITLEALQLYLDRMTEDGIVCFHVSNRYLDLRPVLDNLAQKLGLADLYESDDEERGYPGKSGSTWVVLARKPEYLERLYQWVMIFDRPVYLKPPFRTDRWLMEQVDFQAALWPLIGWPDGGAGLSALAMLQYGFAEEVGRVWKPVRPRPGETKWPDPAKVGVWTDDYSNLLSVFVRP